MIIRVKRKMNMTTNANNGDTHNGDKLFEKLLGTMLRLLEMANTRIKN